MSLVISLLLGLTLLLAPTLAALPDEALWSSWLCAGVMLAALIAVMANRKDGAGWFRISRPETAFLLLLGLAFLSMPARLIVQHGTGFFGPMLRGWSLLATNFALFALARRVAADRRGLYLLVLAAVVGSVIAADIGVQEYAVHLRMNQPTWRIFGTSTPDYLAGYFVLLIPVTLAVFLEAPAARGLTPLLRAAAATVLGVVLLFQLVALLATSSRFALGSLAVSLLTFAVALAWAVRRGYRLERWLRYLAAGMALCVLLAGARFAGPVLARLHNLHDNSTAFRVWTWKGSVKMAAANPILGTGIGTWPDLYPRYALTGFTRVAHNGYLQMADECGLSALLALLATLGLLGVSLGRGLARDPLAPNNGGIGEDIRAGASPAPTPTPPELGAGGRKRKSKRTPTPVVAAPPKADFLPTDHRLLLCGLLAALVGGMTQNLIDSDWNIFFLGTTFWTLAGLAAGIADPPAAQDVPPAPRPLLLALGSVAAALCVLTATEGIAALSAAAQDYDSARLWDPLNGRYASDQGYKVFYLRGGDLTQAETALRTAVALEPNSVNYRRMGTILQQGGRQTEALQAYENGLLADPNGLDLLLDLARLSPPPRSLDYYKRLSDLELTPVGTVRALGESTETKFAVADAALGNAAAKTNSAQASAYYTRAADVLERFAGEGGSMNEQQMALSGGKPNPSLDVDMRGLYEHVLTAWIALVSADQQASLRQRQQKNLAIFDDVLSRSSKAGIL